MQESYLEVTFRRGHPVAAYYYLPRLPGQRSHRTVPAGPGILIDFGRDGLPIGIELTAPGKVSLEEVNRVLRDLGLEPMGHADFAPLRAA